jgi:tetratricopeptide (TPR) repeat protein
VELNPRHVRTLNDLSNLYARAGRFDEQLAQLRAALERTPDDDDLAEGVLTALLLKGRYTEAETLIGAHHFQPRHRSYGLRDKYRLMRYAQGSAALNRGDAAAALRLFEESLRPPVSLGVDDFAAQSTSRQQYYLGRACEALGRKGEAEAAYGRASQGFEQLSGDRDSWNSGNYFMVLALERLGRGAEAARLRKRFADFAQSELDDRSTFRRAEARYLLGLIRKDEGRLEEAQALFRGATEARPELLDAWLELRSEVPDPIAGQARR